MTAIRSPAVAGTFYPADPAEARRQVHHYLDPTIARLPADAPVPKAIVVPHAGWIYSGPVAATAYARLIPAKGRIARVVLIGPSHRVGFRGLAVDTATAWRTPLGDTPEDRAALESLAALPDVGILEEAHAHEHALEVQLPFLQAVLGTFSLIPIVAGTAGPDAVAALLELLWGGPETLIVVSTDLSHYLDYDRCQSTDRATAQAIQRLDPLAIGSDNACGRVPLSGLLLCARRRHLRIETLDLRNSGDTAGPRDRVVGYGSWALFETSDATVRPAPETAPDTPSDGPTETETALLGPVLTGLARASILSGLRTGHPLPPPAMDNLPAALTEPGAVFVTLTRRGRLRGCIGSPMAWRRLVEDVCDNAFKAAFQDRRFPPLTAAEADGEDGFDLSVSLLTPPEPMRFSSQDDLLAQLRPRVDGLLIEDAGRRALFLPAVWEQLPDPVRFLGDLKRKAGLAPNHWSPTFHASRFQAIEFHE